jgi:23S rRNA (uracil1939-C5)-methyltransferase
MRTPSTVSVGQRLRVTIERMVFQGSGLGRLPDGRVVFVPYAAPGDEVEIQVTEAREDFVRAHLAGVRTPSPIRVTPPCRYYGNCGGCQWQHLEYASQLQWKREILRELLARVGKLQGMPVSAPVAPAVPGSTGRGPSSRSSRAAGLPSAFTSGRRTGSWILTGVRCWMPD